MRVVARTGTIRTAPVMAVRLGLSPKANTAFVASCLIASIATSVFGQEPGVVMDPREDWELARVRSELHGLAVRPETECSTSTISEGWGSKEPEIADLHGGQLSPYDGVCFPNFHYVDIDHIVARKEADESGMCHRPLAERGEFAVDLLNLTFAPSSLNSSKGELDAGDLASAGQSLFRDALTADGRCFWAAHTVRVKSKYDLSVDSNERDALAEILDACEAERRLARRPRAPAGCGWMIRPQFAAALEGTGNAPAGSCLDEPRTQSWKAALQHADEITCVAELQGPTDQDADSPTGSASTGAENPRASQIAAQEACKPKLDRITCAEIKKQH